MKIIFLGTGPAKPTKSRTNSSVLVDSILIDCTSQFLKQAKRENLSPKDIRAVLITHAHKDAIQGLKDLDRFVGREINLYAPPRVDVYRFVKKFNNLKVRRIMPHKVYNIEGHKVTPFRLIHYEFHPLLGKKFPTYGYRIDGLVYAEDMESIPANSTKYFKNADTIIADGSMWLGTQIRGHLSVDKTLLLAKRFEPDTLVIIQAGRTYPPQEEAESKILEKWNKIKGNTKTRIILSYDGMKLSSKEESEKTLQAFGSPGGKSHIVDKLLKLVPEHKVYIEPFAGGAALFWKKKPAELEVLNDKDSEIAFAYNYIKHLTEEQIKRLNSMDWTGNKEKFFRLRDSKVPSNPTERFYRFYYVHYHSYGGSRKTFGYKKQVPSDFRRLLKEKERLKNTRIFHGDYDLVIKKFDSKDAFIYLDPPYPGEWPGHTGIDAWGEKEVKELHEVLKNAKGKWLLSINDLPWIRKIFSDFKISRILVPRKFRKGDKPKYELLISNYDIKNLAQEFPGIYLPKPHAEMIWTGEKKLIIKAKNYKNMVGKPLYYMDDEFSYGILELKKPKQISLKEFKKLKDKHKITEQEKNKWWDGKESFYAFEFEILDRFEDPKDVEVPVGTQTFVKETKFLQSTPQADVRGSIINDNGLQPSWILGKKRKNGKEVKISSVEIVKLIEDVKNYDPSKPNNEQLADDWRIVNGWYATYKKTEGKGIKFSKEDIVNLAKLIYDEIVKRVKENRMKHEFKPEKMKPSSLELYKIVSAKSIMMQDWRDLKFLDNLDDFIVIKDCISLIGSSVTQEHKPHDIDILIRMDEPENSFLKRAIEVRLAKLLPEELQDKLHFVWGEKEGPHDSYIPLFDLQFKRIRPVKIITMVQDRSSKIQLMEPYSPMKPLGSAIYDLDKFIEILT